ncbi:hypothetical protein E0Z10_g10432 [Xylaria hypoxylon]|uniref:Rhodopsin domain-containing protein n=1 Tax=Xylaria hypoxylon TaxID=37992 RepID=A0A4Z0YHD1_9PEZI|nr:hypothetical protein E0Z10_g10432 [Xylaria hypoxylon]
MSAVHASTDYVGWRVEVFIGVFTPLTVLLVALRFYARSLTASRYGFEDWLVLFALLAQLLQTGLIIGSIKQGGVGLHVEYLEETQPEKVTIFLKYLVAESIWYLATIWIAKLSICILYRRLFPGRWVYIILCIIIFILIGTSIATVVALLVACRPFSANWGPPEVQNTHCIDKEPIFVWGTLPNVITDAIMLVIPLPIVWKLHMATNLKMALTITFLVGGIGLVASILRLASFHNTQSFTDATYNGAELQIWTLAEGGIYLISASLLVCRPLLEKIRRDASLIRTKRNTAGPSGGAGDYELGRAPYGRQRNESQQSIRKNDDHDHLWVADEENQIGRSRFVAGASNGLKNSQKSLHGSLPHQGDPGETGITRTTVIQQSWDEAR